MTARHKPYTDPTRKGLIAKIKIGQKQLGWDDDFYRETLKVQYGVTSSTELSLRDLEGFLGHMKRCGFMPKPAKPGASRQGRQQAVSPEQKKIRALWISLWNLGLLHDNSDDALASFCARVTGGKDAPDSIRVLQWVRGKDATDVIEALKDWAERDGGVSPAKAYGFKEPRLQVLVAQWTILHNLGAVNLNNITALTQYLARALKIGRTVNLLSLTDSEADAGIRLLGDMIRKAKKGVRT